MQDDMIAWAAGLLEGEGYFGIFLQKGMPIAILRCRMTDKDVVFKLKDIFGVGNLGWVKGEGTRQETWCWTVYKQLDIYEVLIKIRPYLLSRRGKRVDEIFSLLNTKQKIIERNKNEASFNAG